MLRLCLCALFAAIIAAGAFVAIPLPFTPVPLALQNLFIVLSGLLQGPVWGFASAVLYLAAGALGLPVFAGATGGLAHFAGPTGGFLAGYALCALLSGLIAGDPRKSQKPAPLPALIAACAAGLLVIYVPGIIRLYFIVGSWKAAFFGGVLPFLPGDAIKGCVAFIAAGRLRRLVADLSRD